LHQCPEWALQSLKTKYKQLVRVTKPTGSGEIPKSVAHAQDIEALINKWIYFSLLHRSYGNPREFPTKIFSGKFQGNSREFRGNLEEFPGISLEFPSKFPGRRCQKVS
jgi:hypothetical protein